MQSNQRIGTGRRVWRVVFAVCVAVTAAGAVAAQDDLLLDEPPAQPAAGDDLLLDAPPAQQPATPPPSPAPDPSLRGTHAQGSAGEEHDTGSHLLPPGGLHYDPAMSPGVELAPLDFGYFGPDPTYEDHAYDYQGQLDIYGAKYLNPTQRPLLELGRELYNYGVFQPAPTWLGETNPMMPQLLVYGDFRTAVAYNDNGAAEKGVWGNRLNLEVDMRLTSTERIHAFFRPLDKNGDFLGLEFGGDAETDEHVGTLDGNLDALFFEGDLGAIMGGIGNTQPEFDLPIAFGLMPLLFQNGVWVEDAFTGFAFTLPAKNNRVLDWSNFDITFFAGFDRVTTGAFPAEDHDAAIYGVTAFIEEGGGYWEIGYGFADDKEDEGLDYHNFAIAYTRRYLDILSNSIRVIGNFGQDPDSGKQTADGFVVLLENSLITDSPSTFVPYFNLFAGFDRPQSLARDAGAGGILKNTGINFETDGLTGYPKLDDTGFDTMGAAVGVNLLGANLDNQLVVEGAVVVPRGDDDDRVAMDNQYAIGARYQHPISNAMILRLDAMYGWREDDEDIAGIRFEIRYKF